MNNRTKSRRWIWWGLGVVVLAAAAFLLLRNRQQPSQAEESGDNDIVTVVRGDLSASASASGRLVAQQDASLAVANPGSVKEVLVTVGDQVDAGDLLVRLDTAALERAVVSAEQALIIQQANLASLENGPTESELASAEASVLSAQVALDDLLDGPNADDVRAAEARVQAAQASIGAASATLNQARQGGTEAEILEAQNTLANAQEAYTTAEEAHRATYDCDYIEATGGWDCTPKLEEAEARVPAIQALADLRAAEENLANLLPNGDTNTIAARGANVASAVAQRDAAQAQLDLLLAGPTDAEIAAARGTLAQAEKSLSNLIAGASESDLAIAEAQVRQAEIALEQAQLDLADASLVAPFDGLITAVNVSVGEQASGTLIQIINLESLEVVLEIDEIDIALLDLGMVANVTLESFPEAQLSGEIVSIAPKNNSGTGTLVTYNVNLRLAESEFLLRADMTANAVLVTANREDVLLVPNRAITADRQRNTFTVNRLLNADQPDGLETEEIEIVTGLRDNQFTEVIGGLSEGDELVVGDNIPRFGPGSGNGPPDDDGPGG